MTKKNNQNNQKKKKNYKEIYVVNTVRLSICMIVKDEEKNLPECLKSIENLADEIVLVDTGSTDKTIEIAKKFGAKIFLFPWVDDFSAARNESLSHATGDWIIWLDADDRLYPTQHKKIKKLANGPSDQAYFFVLQNRGIDEAQCIQLRMFPNRPDIQFERPVHEQVGTSISKIGLPMIKTDVSLIHTGYSSHEVLQEKKKRYISMMENWLTKYPKDSLIRYQYAWALHTMDQHNEAIDEFQILLQDSSLEKMDAYIYLYSLIMLGRSYLNVNQLENATEAFEKAEKVDNKLPFLKLSIAETHVNKRNYNTALEILEKLSLDSDKSISPFPLDYSILKYGKLVLMGKSYLELDQYDKAKSVIQKAIQLLPQKPEGFKYLAELKRKQGKLKESISAYQDASSTDPQNYYYDFQIGEIYYHMGFLVESRKYYLDAKRKNPNHPAIWMNLALVERGCGNFDLALKYLSHVKKYFKNIPDIEIQLVLTFFDKCDFQKAYNILLKIEQNETIIWMKYLLLIKLGKIDEFEKELQQKANKLELKQNISIFDYLHSEVQKYQKEQNHIQAELILKLLLCFEQDKEILNHLAQIQMKNKRIFQTIETLEYKIKLCSNVVETIPILEELGVCYKNIGALESYHICKENISKLKLQNQQVFSFGE